MLKNKTVLKILSILIAIGLWMYVMGSINPTTRQTIENIPVELLNQDTLEERGLAIREEAGFSVNVVLEGNRSVLQQLDSEGIRATADVFGYEEGESSVPVQVTVPDNTRLKEVKPARINVTVDRLVATNKKVDVKFIGKAPADAEPKAIDMSPIEIEVKGAKKLVDSIKTLQVEINAAKLTDSPKAFQENLQVLNENGDQVYDVTLSAETVEVDAALYYTKTVPLEIKTTGRLPKKYELESLTGTEKIEVCGLKGDLDDIDKIETKPVDMSKIKANTVLELNPILPSGVELAKGSKKPTAEIKIKHSTE